jgi:hypothetical protein
MSEKFLEHGQNGFFDKPSGPAECVDQWRPLDWFRHSLIEHWKKCKFGIHVHLVASIEGPLQLNTRYYCARFENASEFLFTGNTRRVGRRDGDVQKRIHNRRRRNREGAVLVPVGDYVKLPKEPGFWPLPAVVWLQALDKCSYPTWDSGHHVPSVVNEDSVGPNQRELNQLGRLVGSGLSEQPHEMVQDGPELMSRFSDQNADHRRCGLDSRYGPDQFPIRVHLFSNSIKTFAEKRLGCLVDRFHTFLRPPDLPPDVIERVVGHA